jgi:hypothetical protein
MIGRRPFTRGSQVHNYRGCGLFGSKHLSEKILIVVVIILMYLKEIQNFLDGTGRSLFDGRWCARAGTGDLCGSRRWFLPRFGECGWLPL